MKFLAYVLIGLLMHGQCFASPGQSYSDSMRYNEPAVSYKQFKQQNGYADAAVKTTWVDTAYDIVRAAASVIANAIRAVGRFVVDAVRFVPQRIGEMLAPFRTSLPSIDPTQRIGFFRQTSSGVSLVDPMTFLTPQEQKVQLAEETDLRRIGARKELAYRPTLYSHGNGAVTVDMPLNWLRPAKPDSGVVRDVVKGEARDNRWEMATDVGAKEVAQLIDTKNTKLIEVGGVNVENGLGTAKIAEILKRIHIPDNAVLVIGHSAGSHAITKAMSMITRDKSEVYWLLLSPRITQQKTEGLIRKAGIPFDHVMSITNRFDFPHSIRVIGNPLKWHVNHAYDKAPWAHVWLESGVEWREKSQGVKRLESIKMEHGTMYEHLATDASIVYWSNKTLKYGTATVSDIVNRFMETKKYADYNKQ